VKKEGSSLERVELTVLVCDRSRYTNALWSQFGLSLLLDCWWHDHSMKRILFDVGWEAAPLFHNMSSIGISPESVDACVLSHSHYDHTGGLSSFLGVAGSQCKIVAHADITRPVFSVRKTLRFIGLDPLVLETAHQSHLLLVETPEEIYPGVWVTGTIPRRTGFEEPEQGVYVMRDGVLVPDPERDDMALVLDLGVKGIMVVTGCAHGGIINTILAAQDIFQKKKIFCLFGGFHLIDVPTGVRDQTLDALVNWEIEKIWTGHCTGWEAEVRLDRSLGHRFTRFFTGDRLTLSSSTKEGPCCP
jgi:7,8-dihydropterin-6-yl-methyl-4-(beta-D-ribofuranosyl)aminobenzene 5'-phosphate synthase